MLIVNMHVRLCAYVHRHESVTKQRGLAGVEKQNDDKPVSRSPCVY